jgi:rhamnulose-1-phosphate aldolase
MKYMYKGKKIKREVTETILSISEVAGYLWENGWAERNAGNISVNISHYAGKQTIRDKNYPHFDLDCKYPDMAGELLIVSGTGTRMRDLAVNPIENLLIIQIDKTGEGYSVLSPLRKNKSLVMPTSELSTHLSVHEMFLKTGSKNKVVLHSHVTELIALTHITEFCDTNGINDLIFGMHPETMMFIPGGVEFIPFLKPGTKEIAEATVNALNKRDIAIWEKHGVFAAGPDIIEAFDMLDILAKAVSIYFMCRNAGYDPKGLS